MSEREAVLIVRWDADDGPVDWVPDADAAVAVTLRAAAKDAVKVLHAAGVLSAKVTLVGVDVLAGRS